MTAHSHASLEAPSLEPTLATTVPTRLTALQHPSTPTSPEVESPPSVLQIAAEPSPGAAPPWRPNPKALTVDRPRHSVSMIGASVGAFVLGVFCTGSVLASGVTISGTLPLIVATAVTLVAGGLTVVGRVRRAQALESARLGAVTGLARALDVGEAGTSDHSTTVAGYTQAIAQELGFESRRVERIRIAGFVHDIGEVAVPDAVLLAPGKHTERESKMMRRHPELGARMLGGMGLDDIQGWVWAHHERPDGSGYPLGLSGAQIPIEASILAVADAYEGMTSDRVYRDGLDPAKGQSELLEGRGTQFDAEVVNAFMRCLDRAGAVPNSRPDWA